MILRTAYFWHLRLIRDTLPKLINICSETRPNIIILDMSATCARRATFVQEENHDKRHFLSVIALRVLGLVRSMHHHSNRLSSRLSRFFFSPSCTGKNHKRSNLSVIETRGIIATSPRIGRRSKTQTVSGRFGTMWYFVSRALQNTLLHCSTCFAISLRSSFCACFRYTMSATKANMHKSFGKHSRFTKARGWVGRNW